MGEGDGQSSASSAAEVTVVGAGAAGLWCAWQAALAGRRVLLLEKTPRTGTKILASGGTRCNLTTTLDGPGAARLFGRRGARFLAHGLRILPPHAVREHFHRLGVPTVEAPLEKIFPASQRARDVRDALERAAREAGVELRLGQGVRTLAREGDAWRLELEEGPCVRSAFVVIATGGRSYPRTGTTGDAYPWLASLGLPLVEPVPALVPLASPEPWVRALTGVALEDVEVRVAEPTVGDWSAPLTRRRRPVVFTHTGLSGPGAMDLSEGVARGRVVALKLDLYPDHSPEACREVLLELARTSPRTRLSLALARAGWGLPRRVLERVAAQAGCAEPDPPVSSLDRARRHDWVLAAKGLDVPVDGTSGWDAAEVTAGGLDLSAVDPGSMAVRGHPGLYAIGEVLDLQGPIGGLNFQGAFATAQVAADALGRR